MKTMLILKLLDALLMLAASIPALRMRFQAIREAISDIDESGRELTDDEWEEIGSRSDARLARLKARG